MLQFGTLIQKFSSLPGSSLSILSAFLVVYPFASSCSYKINMFLMTSEVQINNKMHVPDSSHSST